MKRPSLPASSPRSAGAFTLVEMVITLAIFVLLAGAVFGIITATLESADSLQNNQDRRDQTMALQEYLRNQLNALPGTATFVSYKRGDGEGLDQNGIIFGTAGLLTALDARVQPNGLYTIRMANFSSKYDSMKATQDFTTAVTGDDASLNWRDLVHDVRHVDWKFMDANATEWVPAWGAMNDHPKLVQFTFQLAGELQPTVTDLWIPPIAAQLNLAGQTGTAVQAPPHAP